MRPVAKDAAQLFGLKLGNRAAVIAHGKGDSTLRVCVCTRDEGVERFQPVHKTLIDETAQRAIHCRRGLDPFGFEIVDKIVGAGWLAQFEQR